MEDDFLRMLSGEEESLKAILRFYVETKYGHRVMYSQEVPDENSFKQLYLPSVDRTVHAIFAGYSPDRIRYIRFELQEITDEELALIDYDFLDSGWDKDVLREAFR